MLKFSSVALQIAIGFFAVATAHAESKVPTLTCISATNSSGQYTQLSVTQPDLNIYRYLAFTKTVNVSGMQGSPIMRFDAEGSVDYPVITPRLPEFREAYVKFYDLNGRTVGGMNAAVKNDVNVLVGAMTLFNQKSRITCKFN